MNLRVRDVPQPDARALREAGVHPVLARLYAARGISRSTELEADPKHLLPPDALRGLPDAARLLADCIEGHRRILIVADYDCDGATACAVGLRGLRTMGAQADFLVPNRFEHGYGLTPAIVDLAAAHPRLGRPDLIVTVDNGIASVDGVERANALGIEVLVTDHHLPGERLPAARAIVNPNQPGCDFPSKHLAGVGVMFYVLLGLRAELRRRGHFGDAPGPALQSLLDLVALGTVADLVRLDRNNRILVDLGLRRIRAGRACAGITALFAVAGRDQRRAGCGDLGFALGPRINAAGRLSDITLGIECLLTDDPTRASALATQLDAINRERRQIETGMREEALADAGEPDPARHTLVIARDHWHEGVVGLVASRLKDRHHRPAFAFAPSAAEPGTLRGSGRSIAGIHLRDVLDLVSKRHPGLILRFGGHAMAAGLTLDAGAIELFAQALERAVADSADPGCFDPTLVTDGGLAAGEIDLDLVGQLDAAVWGQGFPPPLFCDRADVLGQRLVAERHLKLDLRVGGARRAAIVFGRTDPLPRQATIVYRLARNDYGGQSTVEFVIEEVEAVEG